MTRDLSDFLPYLLNQSAELVSKDFQPIYKGQYGMLRTEWRVLYHLGRHGDLTAKQICRDASLHKTKVSRAVVALEKKRFVQRRVNDVDRRFENLSLTKAGRSAFDHLSLLALAFERAIEKQMGAEQMRRLKEALTQLVDERTVTR